MVNTVSAQQKMEEAVQTVHEGVETIRQAAEDVVVETATAIEEAAEQ